MGQKVRPTGFRVGVMIGWKSQWYAGKREFSDLLVEDTKIRRFIMKILRKKNQQKNSRPGISKIQIDRTREKVVITIWTSKAGMIINKRGGGDRQQGQDRQGQDRQPEGVASSPSTDGATTSAPAEVKPVKEAKKTGSAYNIDSLQQDLEKLIKRRIDIRVMRVDTPEIDPQIVSETIAEDLEKRSGFRRVMKKAMQEAMKNGAKGIRLQLSGRLGGAEMARCEKSMEGSIPLSTLRAKVEYGFSEANTAQGNIGVKVWINNGDYLTEETIDATDAQTRKVSKKSTRQNKR